jgi:uncharacterized damage-inducible protein DinB
MRSTVDDTVRTIEAVTREAQARFGGLSADALNRAPGPGQWSIAQCLDHLITINRLYFPTFAALAAGRYQPSLWARISPFSGFFGRFLVNSLRPENLKPMKTTARAQPASRIAADIVERFVAHQEELASHIRAIPATRDADHTRLTSPLMGLVTYNLTDCLTMLAVHEQRHLNQATRVLHAFSR